LLLRADLHRLFDAKLLAIDPETGIVRLDPAVAAWPDYAALDGKVKLRAPSRGFEWAKPSKEALAVRWRSFSGDQA
jgi:hypothetical protein